MLFKLKEGTKKFAALKKKAQNKEKFELIEQLEKAKKLNENRLSSNGSDRNDSTTLVFSPSDRPALSSRDISGIDHFRTAM